MNYISSLLDYIKRSPTPFHCIQTSVQILKEHGFIEKTNESLHSKHELYFAQSGGYLVAFKRPQQTIQSIKIVGAHSDSPCLKIKSNPSCLDEGGVERLSTEVYGGALWNSWLDRDLGIAGQIFYSQDNEIHSTLICENISARIPQLAIHLDRGVNENGLKLNPELHLSPYFSINSLGKSLFKNCLAQWVKCPLESILSWDLCLFDQNPPSLGGINSEFIYSARLDNLASAHAAITSFCQSTPSDNTLQMIVLFNHEEVGSTSLEGAQSQILNRMILEIFESFQLNQNQINQIMAQSLFISADMAHAVHAAFPDKHDRNHRPLLNAGPVLKINSNQRYATDAQSMAQIKYLAQKHQIPLQVFHARADLGCGSTIGPSIAASLGIRCIDLGTPMLSMHSIREMAATEDHQNYIRLLQSFFENQI